MNSSKPLFAALFGVAFVTLSGAAMAQTVNGHRSSDHTLDSTNHPYEALYTDVEVRQPATNGFTTISPRDRELQRIDDIKRQRSDGFVANTGPRGSEPILSPRDRELLRLGAERDRLIGG
ncbi:MULTISPECIES: hypothetical protein [unclassified Beijerinckia]|uniref:hypothetical protein n=1 Tax=unclassified Beijerinckia TaxID=2638183 RepID=UPI00089BEC19|nr:MULTISPECIES: hypothetical protein [unclassified Beijerinckia]MDH7799747.1 hypothetical protein [Beijerinckia sp. GAS462]SED35806.1 hypothetical protein SAMN05443249_5165 [Beijerinckia sp. 28-YEA-48]